MGAADSIGEASSAWLELGHFSSQWVQRLAEAFDGNANGFVTVKEANDFTCSRPRDWRSVLGKSYLVKLVHVSHSLPHRLAYWATGDCHCYVCCGGFRLTIIRLADGLHKLL